MILSAPLHIHWEVTNKCNYKCKHCYQQHDGKRVTLPTDDLLFIANQIVKAGVFQVSISGGEPFSVDGILDILDFLKNNNIRTIICSNGSQINSDTILALKNMDMPVQISLDSCIEKKHNEFRGSENAFDVAVTAIRLLNSAEINTSVAFCATQYNYEDFEGVVKLCIDLGVKHIVVGEMIPVRGGDETNGNLLFSLDTYKIFSEKLKNIIIKYNGSISIHVNSEWGFVVSDFYDHAPCTAFDRDFAILADGSVSPCPFIRNPLYFIGNVLENTIEDLWIKAKRTSFYKCKNLGCDNSCSYYEKCLGGCKAQLANSNQNISRRDLRCPIM